jgi:hypothetical protein
MTGAAPLGSDASRTGVAPGQLARSLRPQHRFIHQLWAGPVAAEEANGQGDRGSATGRSPRRSSTRRAVRRPRRPSASAICSARCSRSGRRTFTRESVRRPVVRDDEDERLEHPLTEQMSARARAPERRLPASPFDTEKIGITTNRKRPRQLSCEDRMQTRRRGGEHTQGHPTADGLAGRIEQPPIAWLREPRSPTDDAWGCWRCSTMTRANGSPRSTKRSSSVLSVRLSNRCRPPGDP